jgi:hypothetical protein
LSDAAEEEANNLRLRANVTILECLHSETISLGVVSDATVYWRRMPCLRSVMPIKGETLRSSKWIAESHFLMACRAGLAGRRVSQSRKKPAAMKIHRAMLLVLITAAVAAMPVLARSQFLISSGEPTAISGITAPGILDLNYVRPTQRTKVINYGFDAFGPYPIVGAAFGAGINQANITPPEWNQGAESYAKRFGSNYGIAIVATTTRYGLSEAFKEDAMYYRCECRGILPRVRHAIVSTLTARRGENGHRVFSIPALVGPYAGTMAASYGWYPSRYSAKDAFRTGNYSLLAFAGENISLEFLYSGPHSLLHRMHLNNAHGSPEPGPNH